MKFYRVENDEGQGVYRRINGLILEKSYFTSRHPEPLEDSGLREEWLNLSSDGHSHLYVFGFSSLEQFKSWFYNDSDLAEFYNYGFSLKLFEAENVIKGNSQAIAKQSELKLIKEFSLDSITEKKSSLNSK